MARTLLVMLVLPFPAWAEVCEKIRPRWVPGTQATTITEATHLFTTLPSVILLVLSVLVVVKRSQWGGLGTVVLWSGFVSVIAFVKDPFVGEAALAEGCIGSPALFIAAVTAICIAIILYTLPRETRL